MSDVGERMMFEVGRSSLSASPSANPVSDIEEVKDAKNDDNQSVCCTETWASQIEADGRNQQHRRKA